MSFSSPADTLSSVLSFVVLLVLLTLPLIILDILSLPPKRLLQKPFRDKFG